MPAGGPVDDERREKSFHDGRNKGNVALDLVTDEGGDPSCYYRFWLWVGGWGGRR